MSGAAGQLTRGNLLILVTLPARMHRVHTWSRRGDPLTRARTRWMLGSQRRFVRRWE
jgi:hypothetical protein